MARVLHLLSPDPDFHTRRGAAGLAREAGAGFEFVTRTVGPGGDYRSVGHAFVSLRREGKGYDVVHAWAERSVTAAALAGVGRVLFTPDRFLSPRSIRWLRAVLGHRELHVVCPTATLRRACVQRGFPIERCHLIRPGVEFGRVKRRRDPDLRRRLGLSDDDRVLLVPGESTRAAAHEHAVWAASIVHIVDPRFKVLIWGTGERAREAVARGANLQQHGLVRSARAAVASVEPEELLGAADGILVTAKGPVSTLPIATCMAAALPIVSTVTYTVAELLEDRHNAVLTPTAAPPAIARRILELHEDPQLQWTISDVARTEAYEYLSFTRFLNAYRDVYRQMTEGRPVQVAEPAPGAGSRFHGRG